MKSYRYLLTIAFICSFVSSSLAQPLCVDCFSNVVGPDLYRKAKTDNGQVDNVVTVKIGSEWATSPDQLPPKLVNAVNNAIARWNAADPTGPRIQLDQTAADNKVSVKITKRTLPMGVLARAVPNIEGSAKTSGTMNLALDPVTLTAATMTEENLTGIVAHEFGHNVKGITHPVCANTTGTIMAPSEPNGVMSVTTVQPLDVDAARKFRENKSACIGKAPVLTRVEDFQYQGTEIVTDPPYENLIPHVGCIETWQYTDFYYCFDGCHYIGTLYERISPACGQ
jgi:hypothetical protein